MQTKTRALREHLEYKIPKFRLAMIRENDVEPIAIYSPDDIERFIEPLKHFSEEYFLAFHLDTTNHITGYHEVSHGTLSASLVHPREVFKAALLTNAHSIIVAHNHPSGGLTPSSEDLETTAKLIEAGKLLGVPVVDHIIVSYRGTKSIREYHPELWR